MCIHITRYVGCLCFLILLAGCATKQATPADSTPSADVSAPTLSSEETPSQQTPTPDKTPSAMTVSEPTQTRPAQHHAVQKWHRYVNSRYHFAVSVPESWGNGVESDNGDGIRFFGDDPDLDIRVYATHIIEGISDPYQNAHRPGFEHHRIKLERGQDAVLIIGTADGMRHYDMVLVENNIEYHVYAHVTEHFYRQNEQVLREVVDSFDLV